MGNNWHPNGCGVLIKTQDGMLDLADVTWQQVARCGCICGLTVAATDELIVTPEQAGRHFCESEAEYKRDVERGFTWRPREHKAACDEYGTKCTHEPKYGCETPPKPEGYVWAAVHALGSRQKFTHLVSTEAVERRKAHDYSVLDSKPLCGGKAAYHWIDEWYAKSGKIECSKCIAAGKRLIEAGAA